MMGDYGFMGIGMVLWIIILVFLVVAMVELFSRPREGISRERVRELEDEIYRLKRELRELKAGEKAE